MPAVLIGAVRILLVSKKLTGHLMEDGVASYLELGDSIDHKVYNGDTASLDMDLGHRISQSVVTEGCKDAALVHPDADADLDGGTSTKGVGPKKERTSASAVSDQQDCLPSSHGINVKASDCDDASSKLSETTNPSTMPKTSKGINGEQPYVRGSAIEDVKRLTDLLCVVDGGWLYGIFT